MEKKHKPHKNYMHHNDISDSSESSSNERVNKQQIIKPKLSPLKSEGKNSAFHSKITINKIKQEEKVKIKRKSIPKFESSSDEKGDMTSEETISQGPVDTSSGIQGKHIKEEKLTKSEKQKIHSENISPKKNKSKKIMIIPDSPDIEESKRNSPRISKNIHIKEEYKSDDELEQCLPKKIKHKFNKTINENLQLAPIKGSKKKLKDSLISEPTVLYPQSENIFIKQEANEEPKKKKLKKKISCVAGENIKEVIKKKIKTQTLTDVSSDGDSQSEMLGFSDFHGPKRSKIANDELNELSPQKIKESKWQSLMISKNTHIKKEKTSDDEMEQRSPKKIKHKFNENINENFQLVPIKGSKKKPKDLYLQSESIVIKQEVNEKPKKKKLIKKVPRNAGGNTKEVITLITQPSTDISSDSDSQCEMLEFSDTDIPKKLKIAEEEINELSLENSDTRDDYFFEVNINIVLSISFFQFYNPS